jgi:hypothetical protein
LWLSRFICDKLLEARCFWCTSRFKLRAWAMPYSMSACYMLLASLGTLHNRAGVEQTRHPSKHTRAR